jgi:hypothetical protein
MTPTEFKTRRRALRLRAQGPSRTEAARKGRVCAGAGVAQGSWGAPRRGQGPQWGRAAGAREAPCQGAPRQGRCRAGEGPPGAGHGRGRGTAPSGRTTPGPGRPRRANRVCTGARHGEGLRVGVGGSRGRREGRSLPRDSMEGREELTMGLNGWQQLLTGDPNEGRERGWERGGRGRGWLLSS